jgi:hypothetical protein
MAEFKSFILDHHTREILVQVQSSEKSLSSLSRTPGFFISLTNRILYGNFKDF